MFKAIGYAAQGSHSHLKPLGSERDDPGPNGVQLCERPNGRPATCNGPTTPKAKARSNIYGRERAAA